MGNRNFRSISDFPRARAMARIVCRGCSRVVTMSGLDAVRAFGPITVHDAERRCRCTSCGRKGARIFPVPE